MSLQDTRTHVVGELYDTERSYVESLQVLVEKYMKPLKSLESNRVLIDSNLVDEIFHTIPEILQHHENFLTALQNRLSSDWDSSQVIGNVFIDAFINQQIIDTYTAFINNWKNARQAIKVATQAKPAFERFLEAMSREHRNKLTLDALLIMPVQRIPRYELLIKELIKHTPDDHPDYETLIEAQKQVHELALKIDRAEKEMIHQEQLKELESMIEGHVEIQHPHRDFIRYDLVTMVGASALAVTKKERVLFLFCDLLIMTSVKKKVSRRSNLQTAFANSCNDLGLLEGNKFKLLLKVSIDQVEVRLEDGQLKFQQQREQQQQQLQLHQTKLIQENKRAIESDLCSLQQIEAIGQKLNVVDRAKLIEYVDESTAHLRQWLFNVEQNDQTRDPGLHHSSMSSETNPQDSISNEFLSASPSAMTTISSNATNNNDSNTSLELIVNYNVRSHRESGGAIPTIASSDAITHSEIQPSSNEPSTNFETLMVTFPSIERRQAFLGAFFEAKRQRFQFFQRRQQQQNRTFSSSLTLRLSQMGSPERRANKSSQDDSEKSFLKSTAHSCQNPSAPNKNGSSSIVHQMSAPQSLSALASGHLEDASCVACSSSLGEPEADVQRRSHPPLTHQPNSQPVGEKDGPGSKFVGSKASTQVEPNIDDNTDTAKDDDPQKRLIARTGANQKVQLMVQMNQNLFFRTAPRFLSSLPLNFLYTQHPALQFTCSVERSNLKGRSGKNTPEQQQQQHQSCQTIKDKGGQLWLCMSNGYVSHVALLELRRHHTARTTSEQQQQQQQQASDADRNSFHTIRQQYRVRPIIRAAGDLCKSHINCAVQVKWKKKTYFEPSGGNHEGQAAFFSCNSNSDELIKTGIDDTHTTLAAGSTTPAKIEPSGQVPGTRLKASLGSRLSASAPSPNLDDLAGTEVDAACGSGCEPSFLSTTRLEAPCLAARKRTDPSRNSLHRRRPDQESVTRQSSLASCEFRSRNAHSVSCTRHQQQNNQGDPAQSLLTDAYTSQSQQHLNQPHRNINLFTAPVKVPSGSPLYRYDRGTFHHHHHQLHTHHHHHHHSHHHSHHHGHHSHGARDQPLSAGIQVAPMPFRGRHHTVHLGELRCALERQERVTSAAASHPRVVGGRYQMLSRQRQHLIPPTNSPSEFPASPIESQLRVHQQDLLSAGDDELRSLEKAQSTTPPMSKSLRSARMLGQQASLKTSSILAKIVGGASRRSYLTRKSSKSQPDRGQNQSDADDIEPETDKISLSNRSVGGRQVDDNSSVDSCILALTTSGPKKCSMATAPAAVGDPNLALISPLSSVSSLASTNSSLAVNSVCASSPNQSACEVLVHSSSITYCPAASKLLLPTCSRESASTSNPGLRSRSATVPSRAFQAKDNTNILCPASRRPMAQASLSEGTSNSYRVSEIVEDSAAHLGARIEQNPRKPPQQAVPVAVPGTSSALWLGCEDGSLLIIDCIEELNLNDGPEIECDSCELLQRHSSMCHNTHSEVKLGSAICDICTHEDKNVFVALSNGQLAVFSRFNDEGMADDSNEPWLITCPKIITVTPNELNSTSRLCLVDRTRLWYSYGKSIFILNVETLKLETTIKAPTKDLSLQFIQSVTIDNMESVSNLSGMWVSFKNSNLIHFYDIVKYKLLIEINLFEPINKILSYGNEIIRQHKTSCLRATSLLNFFNKREQCNTLFIGTSAGIVLYMNITQDQLALIEAQDGSPVDWSPHVASLPQGHSGNVKLLKLLELSQNDPDSPTTTFDANNNHIVGGEPTIEGSSELLLISGGAGIDHYGSGGNNEDYFPVFNNEDDSMNHLLLWRL